jgi:hypothetical protein
MVGIYCEKLDINYILSKEKYIEQFATTLMANWGKTTQLVQCWLIKIDTVQHMGILIASDLSGNIFTNKIQYY